MVVLEEVPHWNAGCGTRSSGYNAGERLHGSDAREGLLCDGG